MTTMMQFSFRHGTVWEGHRSKASFRQKGANRIHYLDKDNFYYMKIITLKICVPYWNLINQYTNRYTKVIERCPFPLLTIYIHALYHSRILKQYALYLSKMLFLL